MTKEQYTQILEAVLNAEYNLIDGFGKEVYNEYFFWLTVNAATIDIQYYIDRFGADYKALAEDLLGFYLLAADNSEYTLEEYYSFHDDEDSYE
jgi:hypothetical protein